MRATFRHVTRLLGIARTLARHDALFPLEAAGVAPALVFLARRMARKSSARNAERRPGQRLAAAFQELGPVFIKLGQALSVRSDLLGAEVAEDLSQLQDRLPPFAAAAARATVEAELGQPIDTLFAAFDNAPVAAASIAQVHFATTPEGAAVAVKILRPGIERAFARDLALLEWLAALVERARPSLRRLKPSQVVETFRASVRIEMDMRLEAAAASEFAQSLADDGRVRVPTVDWQRTAQRVLTLERVEGVPVDEVERLVAAGHDPTALVAHAAENFFTQVFRNGFFHADMHPGNLFVDAEGKLVMVDFGIMGRIDRKTRIFLAEMLVGFLTGDYRKVAEVHFNAGYVPPDQSVDAFMQAARAIAEPILNKPAHEISLARLLAQLFQVTETFKMETQPQLLLLQKSMLVAEGVGRMLDPTVNMWQLARPLIEAWMIENRGPEARLRDGLADAVDLLARLPTLARQVETAVAQLADGGLKLHPDTVRALAGSRNSGRALLWPLWGAVALLLLILWALL